MLLFYYSNAVEANVYHFMMELLRPSGKLDMSGNNVNVILTTNIMIFVALEVVIVIVDVYALYHYYVIYHNYIYIIW